MGMLDNLTPVTRQYTCQVGQYLETLDKTDQKILADALNDSRWSNQGLARALTERGVVLSKHQILAHRNKQCWCARA